MLMRSPQTPGGRIRGLGFAQATVQPGDSAGLCAARIRALGLPVWQAAP
jgi:hypothetical protein